MASMQLLLAMTWMQLTAHVLCCPAGTMDVASGGSTWCVRYNSTAVNFCDAIKTCHSRGEEMISKPVFDAMKSSPAFDGTSIWWVGLSDAVDERGTSKSGWVWMKNGQVTTGMDSYFVTTEPNNNALQDCVTTGTSNKQLRDAGCTELNPFYCFTDPTVQTTNPAKFKFEKSPITAYSQPDPGCSQKLTSVPSRFDCTVKCFTIGPDCVGFYWNSARLECIHLLYFDAAVTLDSRSDWEKLQWEKMMRTS